MDVWTFNWGFWFGGFFLAYELYALITHQRTLSQQTWNWFSLGQHKRYWVARRIIFLVFWLVLGIAHFYFQAPALWSVILPGIPFASVIVLSTFVWKDAATSQAHVVSEKENLVKQKLLNGLVYGAAGVIAAMQATGIPSTKQAWLGLLGVFVTAFWGKISSSQNLLSPNRDVWSPDRRLEAKLGK